MRGMREKAKEGQDEMRREDFEGDFAMIRWGEIVGSEVECWNFVVERWLA